MWSRPIAESMLEGIIYHISSGEGVARGQRNFRSGRGTPEAPFPAISGRK